jgi:hypothetical protein
VPISTTRAIAPIVGSHLPMRNASSTASAPVQTKIAPPTYVQTPGRSKKNFSHVVTATMVSAPPSQTGLDSQ